MLALVLKMTFVFFYFYNFKFIEFDTIYISRGVLLQFAALNLTITEVKSQITYPTVKCITAGAVNVKCYIVHSTQ